MSTKRPLDQMSSVQRQLAAAYNQINGICSDLHYLAHEGTAEEALTGLQDWQGDWLTKIQHTMQYIDLANRRAKEALDSEKESS